MSVEMKKLSGPGMILKLVLTVLSLEDGLTKMRITPVSAQTLPATKKIFLARIKSLPFS